MNEESLMYTELIRMRRFLKEILLLRDAEGRKLVLDMYDLQNLIADEEC